MAKLPYAGILCKVNLWCDILRVVNPENKQRKRHSQCQPVYGASFNLSASTFLPAIDR
jgi:hypothetical protein